MKKTTARAVTGHGPAGTAPRTDPLATVNQAVDPFGIGASFARITEGWLAHPREFTNALAQLARDLQSMQLNAWQVVNGLRPAPAIAAAPDDARFADPAWSEAPAFSLLKQYYLLLTHWLEETLFETPGVEPKERRRAAFWARQWLNALAPTNFLLTNPVAVRKFWESGGQSVAAGLRLWLEDLRAGDVRMVERSAFKVGRDLAATPGSVVYRNELIELIQYSPATAEVHAVPIVIVPPWINKYYILDLNDKKSLIRYLVGRGFTVFVISWKNPSAAQADTSFDDYLIKGLRKAVEVAREICSVPQAHAVGYCIGGTALAALMAWLNRACPDASQVPVAHWSLLTTLTDFSRPGAIEVFIDPQTIGTLEKMMAEQGYLDGREMGRAFRLLRSNSLIWHYFVHGYLYGESPPPFDVLYWNTDVTRMPRAMHGFYLRELYLHNKLIRKDALVLANQPIDLGQIRQPLYAIGCEEDHIAPWKATFAIAGRISAPVRYTLSSSGHILGILNPPVKPPKRWYWSGESAAQQPAEWLERQRKIDGSWWEDWSEWLKSRCGPMVSARAAGSAEYPVLGAAPGTYVHEI